MPSSTGVGSAYTSQRLGDALRLFRRPRRKIGRQPQCLNVDDDFVSKYVLRSRTPNRPKDWNSTWIDDDDDSDYKPSRPSPRKGKQSLPAKKLGSQCLWPGDRLRKRPIKSTAQQGLAGNTLSSTQPDEQLRAQPEKANNHLPLTRATDRPVLLSCGHHTPLIHSDSTGVRPFSASQFSSVSEATNLTSFIPANQHRTITDKEASRMDIVYLLPGNGPHRSYPWEGEGWKEASRQPVSLK
jgi:hypothetical protein